MNTNEISPKSNSRMNRIKIISRIAKWIVLAFLLYSIGFFLWLSSGPASVLKGNVWRTLFIVMCDWNSHLSSGGHCFLPFAVPV